MDNNESHLKVASRDWLAEELSFVCWVVGERQRFGVEPSAAEKQKIDRLRSRLEEIDFPS